MAEALMYDPEDFRRRGHALIDRLADHLAAAQRGEGPVVRWREPAEMLARWRIEPRTFEDFVEQTIEDSIHHHHPRFMGHQVTPPMPLAALADLLASVLNNGMASYDSGPASTAMERAVVRWMASRVGMKDGVLTSGGSLGNLTALLAARAAKGQGRVLVAETVHYSVSRALRVMGLEEVRVKVDERFKLTGLHLDGPVVAVCASAGLTATGAFDPLDEIADFCARHGLWMHVDGAHGASAALSDRYRHLVRGIERADSVVWDAHKMMAMPALCTAVLFKDEAASYATFAQDAPYLYGKHGGADVGLRTIECTKRMMSLKLYAALTVLGPEALAGYVTRTFDLARVFADKLAADPDFEVIAPECNIVCFRFRPAADQDLIRDRLVASGRFLVVRTALRGKVYLRTALMNPLTSASDLDALMAAVREAGLP
jgi:L-2,4-diaminobutyrate decarboxylase